MNAKNTRLYFVALVPPSEIYDRVLALKEEVADKFHSKAALKSPPHITLHMPFRYNEQKEERIAGLLRAYAKSRQPLQIRQAGFGAFSPRVIYIQVEKTIALDELRTGLVRAMRRELKLLNADYRDHAFHPHMTIAFRDLKKSIFQSAWDYYKEQEFVEVWECDRMVLLKHNGSEWEAYRHFVFEA